MAAGNNFLDFDLIRSISDGSYVRFFIFVIVSGTGTLIVSAGIVVVDDDDVTTFGNGL